MKFNNLFIHAPFSFEIMFVGPSLECVVSQRSVFGTLIRLQQPLSLLFPYSQRMMIGLRRIRYSVVSYRYIHGLFLALQKPLLIRFSQEAKILLEAGFA